VSKTPTAPSLCPECRAPAAEGARVCAAHGLYVVTPAALEKLDEAPLLGQVLDAKYALIDLVGGGGYGSVYRGLQQPLGREVAVKILHGLALTMKIGRERFEREAQALARLGSTHTVRLIDYGITRDGPIGLRNLPYMVMELIDGEDLERRVARAPLTPTELLEVLDGVADSLDEAHAHGIVHRDLKASNILMALSHTGKVVPKVIDFGIARVEGSNKSQTGFVTGTPAYMAPEQARGEDLDHRVDIYALAAMTFELVAGRPPYMGNDAVAILTQACTAPIPSLRDIGAPAAYWPLDAVMQRGLAKVREERPARVSELVVACREALADAVTAAPQRPTTERPSAVDNDRTHLSTPLEFGETALYTSRPPGPRPPSTEIYASPGAPTPPVVAPAARAAAPWAPLSQPEMPAAEAARPTRRNEVIVGVGIGAVLAVGVAWMLTRPAAPPEAPRPAASAIALPAAPATPAPPTAAAAPPTAAPDPQSAVPVPESAAPAPVTAEPALEAAAPRAPANAGAARTRSPPPVSRAPRGPRAEAPTPPAGSEDAPVQDKPDPAIRALLAEADRELNACKCEAAKRALDKVARLTGGATAAASRRAQLAACKPIDIDHRCVNGRLYDAD